MRILLRVIMLMNNNFLIKNTTGDRFPKVKASHLRTISHYHHQVI